MNKLSLDRFIDYVRSFYYGPDSVYDLGYTLEQLVYAAYVRYNDQEYQGDTLDREKVREYLENQYGVL